MDGLLPGIGKLRISDSFLPLLFCFDAGFHRRSELDRTAARLRINANLPFNQGGALFRSSSRTVLAWGPIGPSSAARVTCTIVPISS